MSHVRTVILLTGTLFLSACDLSTDALVGGDGWDESLLHSNPPESGHSYVRFCKSTITASTVKPSTTQTGCPAPMGLIEAKGIIYAGPEISAIALSITPQSGIVPEIRRLSYKIRDSESSFRLEFKCSRESFGISFNTKCEPLNFAYLDPSRRNSRQSELVIDTMVIESPCGTEVTYQANFETSECDPSQDEGARRDTANFPSLYAEL